MISWITVLAFVHTCKETAVTYWNHFRRNVLVRIAHSGTRNMVLLRSGAWIDAHHVIPSGDIVMRYDAEKHQVVAGEEGGRMVRWPWIGVTLGSRDLMDFFGGLRHSAGHELTSDKALALYMYQKGWIGLSGTLHVTMRDGTEKQYSVQNGYVTEEAAVDNRHVNYIH